jgi:AraC-like DNA-binding protein
VATVLTPIERIHVDVAARGAYSPVHHSRVDEVVEELRRTRVGAVIVSVSRYDAASTARMAAMVREFPRIPTFALLTDVQRSTPHAVHALGQIGVRTLVDVRQASGWRLLRERLMHEQPDEAQRTALAELARDLTDVSSDCWRFFEALFIARPYVATVRQLGRWLHVHPTTLMSRFYRAGLPSPKRYIDAVRLLQAAKLLENPGISIAAVSHQLEYSSPQAFGRHVRMTYGIPAGEFRRSYTGALLLRQFRETLVLPYRNAFRSFQPVVLSPEWVIAAAPDTEPVTVAPE